MKIGFYIEAPTSKGKANYLVEKYKARVVCLEEAEDHMEQKHENDIFENKDETIVIVVDNGPFEAAVVVTDYSEFKRFTAFNDYRPKTFLMMDKKLAFTLSGYTGD